MKKFKIKGLGQDIDLDVESYKMIDRTDYYNINTGDCTIIFELTLTNKEVRYLAVDINIKNKTIQDIFNIAESSLLSEYEERNTKKSFDNVEDELNKQTQITSKNLKSIITITSEGKIKKGKKLPWYKRLWNWAKNLF